MLCLTYFGFLTILTVGPFVGPLSADCPGVEKSSKLVCSDWVFGILSQKWAQRCKNIFSETDFFFFFFFFDLFPTYGRLSNFRHWTGGG